MDRETTAIVYLNCLLVKNDVRPGYIPNIDPTNILYRNVCVMIARRYFKLNTFLFRENLLITKNILTQEEKTILTEGVTNPTFHTTLGGILGYDCVDFFTKGIESISRTSFSYTITLISNESKRLQLFSYVCPGVVENSQIILSPENLQKAIEYVNKIKNVFREDPYARLVVNKVNIESSYIFPFPTIINRDELIANGLPSIPPPPPIETTSSFSSDSIKGGAIKYKKRKSTQRRGIKINRKNKSKRRV